MTFDSAANNVVKVPVVSHSSGAASLVLSTAGTQFPAPPFRITTITGASYGTAAESLLRKEARIRTWRCLHARAACRC